MPPDTGREKRFEKSIDQFFEIDQTFFQSHPPFGIPKGGVRKIQPRKMTMKTLNPMRSVAWGAALFALSGSSLMAANIRYQLSGDYFDTVANTTTHGWQSGGGGTGGLPGSADTARFNWANNTVTLANVAPTVTAFQMGVGESGGLVVNSGGSLTTTGNSTIGNNNGSSNPVNGFLTVTTGGYVKVGGHLTLGAGVPTGSGGLSGNLNLNGGTLEIQSHLWVGARNNTTATIDISNGGTLSVLAGNFGLGTVDTINAGGTATMNVNNGGILNLFQWNNTTSIFSGSVLNINVGGTVNIGGNRVAAANDYFTAGRIGTDGTGIQATYDSGSNLTTIVAIPEPGTPVLWCMAGLAVLLRRRRHFR
jgi:hypothetical protein